MEALLGLFARHILTAVGAVLVAKGYTDEATIQAVGGAAATLIGVGWSVFQKKQSGVMKKFTK